MKKWLAVPVLMTLTSSAMASPYFRVLGITQPIDHPQLVGGALLDPRDLGNTSAVSLLPLITHSPSDGCLFPKIVCEDWTPLSVGASINAGKITLDVAPLANVLPWIENAAHAIAPAKYQDIFNYVPSDVTFSAGPVFEYKQATNRGAFKIFTGLALHF